MGHLAAVILLLFLTIIGAEAYAIDSKCVVLSKKLSKIWERSVPCYCGKELSNLEATPPHGLRIVAVCGLRDGSGRWIDLVKNKVSLNYYDKNGNMPNGEIYFSGQLSLTGTATMEPSDSGELWFGTNCQIHNEPVFLKNFCGFKLDITTDYKKLRGLKPKYDNNLKCWSKDAHIKIIDPVVRLEDTDQKGTYPTDIEVIKIGKPKFFKCYQ